MISIAPDASKSLVQRIVGHFRTLTVQERAMSQSDHVQDANIALQSNLPRGAHLATRRPGYAHHGIYIGNGKVIHYAGFSRRLSRGPVEIVPIEQFAAAPCHYKPDRNRR